MKHFFDEIITDEHRTIETTEWDKETADIHNVEAAEEEPVGETEWDKETADIHNVEAAEEEPVGEAEWDKETIDIHNVEVAEEEPVGENGWFKETVDIHNVEVAEEEPVGETSWDKEMVDIHNVEAAEEEPVGETSWDKETVDIHNVEAAEEKKHDETSSVLSLEKISSEEMALYDIAKFAIKKLNLRKLTETDTKVVWMFNGRFYEPLSNDRLSNLVYPLINEDRKRKNGNIHAMVNSISDFIHFELATNTNKREFFTEQDFSKIQNHIVFENCVFDCATGKCLDFTDKLPYYMGVAAKYVPEECISGAYEKLKHYATGNDKESMLMFDQITAAIFLHRQIKHIFVAGNASNSGKSKYFEFLDALMPPGRSSHLEPSEFKERFALANADTATLFSCADIQMSDIGPHVASTLKRLTGDQYVRCQKKHKDSYEVRVMAKILLGTNGAFATKRPDSGLQNRLIVIPFINSVEPERRDAKLLVKLLADKDIILSHCARTLKEIISDDGTINFNQSAISIEMKNSWMKINDFVDDFIQDELEITGNDFDAVIDKKLYEAYADYYYYRASYAETMNCCKAPKATLLTRLEYLSGGRVENKRLRIDENGNKTKNPVARVRGVKILH